MIPHSLAVIWYTASDVFCERLSMYPHIVTVLEVVFGMIFQIVQKML